MFTEHNENLTGPIDIERDGIWSYCSGILSVLMINFNSLPPQIIRTLMQYIPIRYFAAFKKTVMEFDFDWMLAVNNHGTVANIIESKISHRA